MKLWFWVIFLDVRGRILYNFHGLYAWQCCFITRDNSDKMAAGETGSWGKGIGGKMQTIEAYEAQTNFPAILDKVRNGENLTITLHGVPVVDMRRHNEQNIGDVQATIAEIMEVRKNFAGAFEGENIKALIEEGRR